MDIKTFFSSLSQFFHQQNLFEIVLTGGIIILFLWLTSIWRKAYRIKYGKRIIEQEFNLIEELNNEDYQWIVDILETTKWRNAKDFFKKSSSFEKIIARYKLKKTSSHTFIKNLPYLRQKLGFVIDNAEQPLFSTRQLRTGLQLECFFQFKGRYISYFSDTLVVYEEQFWVSSPEIEGEILELSSDENPITFICKQKNGTQFKFRSRMIHQVNTPYPSLVLEHTEKFESFSPRIHPRKKLQTAVSLFIWKEQLAPEGLAPEDPPPVLGEAKNLSRGGMLFHTEYLLIPIKQGDRVSVQFTIEERKFNLKALVIDHYYLARNQGYIHLQFSPTQEAMEMGELL